MQSLATSSSLTLPPAAALPRATHNLVDDFFGSRESRHDNHRLSLAESVSPPPYVECPEYTFRAPEPVTLAMYLFKFGFFFPPFWILGVIILMSPLRAPPAGPPSASWLPEKTDAERQMIIERMRTTELKWARRCLYALVAYIIIGVVAGVAIWATLRS
ncbi:hypothetical protein MIND_00218000 [Mycena indigotica]|uniref:Transmembrane protein n=1 Tax=Mycena indigotica TaxID=2126181 RepID=A0A8H6WAY3_9AGAR|nr:uncharacterized protein MIND_00218000 [Mycena indigotica]KAF7312059.1 hypothetical protein MIND_00218000 [Mycena indigotica]